jgi:integrase
MTPEVRSALVEQRERIRALERAQNRVIPYVFAHARGSDPRAPAGPKRTVLGARREDFRRAWLTPCREAGVPGRLRHDFRRTAVRNLVKSGVAERVAMTITGHKTRSVFDRYHIVSPTDLQEASRRLAGITAGIRVSASENPSR